MQSMMEVWKKMQEAYDNDNINEFVFWVSSVYGLTEEQAQSYYFDRKARYNSMEFYTKEEK